jgi:hypothetical protein
LQFSPICGFLPTAAILPAPAQQSKNSQGDWKHVTHFTLRDRIDSDRHRHGTSERYSSRPFFRLSGVVFADGNQFLGKFFRDAAPLVYLYIDDSVGFPDLTERVLIRI